MSLLLFLGGDWWVAQQNRVTPSPFDLGLLTFDLDLDCDNWEIFQLCFQRLLLNHSVLTWLSLDRKSVLMLRTWMIWRTTMRRTVTEENLNDDDQIDQSSDMIWFVMTHCRQIHQILFAPFTQLLQLIRSDWYLSFLRQDSHKLASTAVHYYGFCLQNSNQ